MFHVALKRITTCVVVGGLLLSNTVLAQKQKSNSCLITNASCGIDLVQINQESLMGTNEAKVEKVKTAHLEISYNPYVSKKVNQQMVEFLQETDTDMALAFQGVNVVNYFQDNISEWDLDATNLADVLTAFLVHVWQAANSSYKPTYTQVYAVSDQMRRAIRSCNTITEMSTSNMQELAESLIYHSMLIYSIYKTASMEGDEQELQQISTNLCHVFKDSGFYLKELSLTDKGFTALY
jgi:uncharacterized protein YukE